MKAKKVFCIVAYDIEDDRLRLKVSKLLEKFGTRINYSVFECMFTFRQLEETKEKIKPLIDSRSDTIVFYVCCVDCYTKTVYLPERKSNIKTVSLV